MSEKKIDKGTGEVIASTGNSKNCFDFKKRFEGEKDFDKYYIDRVIKQVPKKVGQGEDDYVIVDKVVESKRLISEVINADSDKAGIEAYLAPYVASKTPLPGVKVEDSINDYTKCPENLADAIMLGEDARKAFNNLDPKLTKGMSYEEFITGFKNEMFQDYINKLSNKEPAKPSEDKKGEE